MAFSYSFHLSNKKNAITTTAKLKQVDKHNLRKYATSEHDIVQLLGQGNIVEDVKRIYHEEFDQCLEKYNQNKRADRQIDDYLQHVSNSRTDVAVEIIIQVGDQDFWQNVSKEEREKLTPLFEDQIKALNELVPELKIASAMYHFGEKSPHMHVVGVPVAENYKNGMEKQVAKTKVFTKGRLMFLQDEMRKVMEESMKNYPELFQQPLKEKEKGRNKDIPKESLDEFYALQKTIKSIEQDIDVETEQRNDLKAEISVLERNRALISNENRENLNILNKARKKGKEIIEQLKAQIQSLKNEIRELEQQKNKELSFNERAQYAQDKVKLNKYEKVIGSSPELQKHFNEVEKQNKALTQRNEITKF